MIVEHVIEHQSWYDDILQLLSPFDVFYVGIHCLIEELERRERQRGDRRIGEGRSHIEDGIHTWGPYDFELDSSAQRVKDSAKMIIEAYYHRNANNAFKNGFEDLITKCE